MYDGRWILPGLAVFLLGATYPVWNALASSQGAQAPSLAKPVASASECVLERGQMRRSHMRLLAAWRDEVVRDGQRVFVSASGRRHEKSLTGSCLACHADRSGFCDRCHHYVQADPVCWDCHLDPKGGH
jgi:hypothetical protein